RFGESRGARHSRGAIPEGGTTVFIALGAAAALFLVPPVAREALTWAIALGLSCAVLLDKAPPWVRVSAPIVLLAFGAASISAFRERLLPFPSSAAYELGPDQGGAELMRRQPLLASPLTRVHLPPTGGPFGPNEGLALGLSTLNGYWAP